MQLNHLDLQVADVQRHVVFFETFFGLQLTTSRNSPALAILNDEAGFTLVLQKKKDPTQTYPDGFHLGFLVSDIATVERAHAMLVEHGVHVSNIDTNNRGTMIYCRTPDEIVVEVSCRKQR
jgi:catechol 2,3-dioxygenase-like lactoylglutathione lyase family enzyme